MGSEVLYASLLILAVLGFGNLVLTLAIVRRVNRGGSEPSSTQLRGLEPGETAPDFTAQKLDGSNVTLADLSHRRTVMLFVSPGCKPCEESLPEYLRLSVIARDQGEELVLVSGGDHDPTREMIGKAANAITVIVAPRETHKLFADYRADVTPLFTVIENGHVFSSGMPWNTIQEWRDVLSRWSADSPPIEARPVVSHG